MKEPGDTARTAEPKGLRKLSGKEDRFSDEAPESGNAPKKQSAPAENLSGQITEAQGIESLYVPPSFLFWRAQGRQKRILCPEIRVHKLKRRDYYGTQNPSL